MTGSRGKGVPRNRRQPGADYQVGYRKPPAAHRFRAGQSGNPKGRPRGRKNLGQIFGAIFNGKVDMAERNGRVRRITRAEAMLQNVMAKAVSGEPKQVKLVLDMMERFDVKVVEDTPIKGIEIRYVTPRLSAKDRRRIRRTKRLIEERDAAYRAQHAQRVQAQATPPARAAECTTAAC